VQTALQVGEWRYEKLEGARAAAFAGPPAPASTAEREAATAALRWLGRARRWGALPQPQLDLPIAWAAYFAGDEDTIAQRARTLATYGGDAGTAWSLLARSAERRGATLAAVAAYRNAIEAAPDDARAHLALGLLLAGGGDLTGAGEAFASGLARAPRDADLAYNLGVVEAMRGNVEAAVARFRQALAAAPGHVAARENLAAALAELERARVAR